jgi:hypothetical protein
MNIYIKIQNRYPFFDEPTTKMEILKNYKAIDSFDNYILLSSEINNKKVKVLGEIDKKVGLNKLISIPESNNLVFMDAKVEYTILGELARLFYQPPQLSIEFEIENKSNAKYKIIKTLISEPSIINKYIVTNHDAANLINGINHTIPNIKSFRIIGNNWGFKSEIPIHLEEVKIGNN